VAERPAERPCTTLIGAGASFDGLLTFSGTVRVDGQLSGRVVAEGRLEIGPEARVRADIEVDELVVAGEVEGELRARQRVELRESARVLGSLRTPLLAMAGGCQFEGRCDTRPPGPASASVDASGPGTA
jgi:cytoskeletal protein CcmA (bactofilin family)